MSEDWNAIAAEVGEAIADIGFSALLYRQPTGSAAPWSTTSLASSDGIPVTIVNSKTTFSDSQSEQVMSTDRFVIMSGSIAPKKEDRVVISASNNSIGAGTYRIENVMQTSPSNVDLMFRVQLRK